ncbi:MAG: restriction endonuclease subunit S [Nitrospira sp.]|nr:restriction endonuclease subunit S [Nitrospira sp.]MCE7977021.1 restriction endonuclease [Nitrospira sp. NTP1]
MSEPEKLPRSWLMAPISHIADVNPRSFCPLPGAVDEFVHFVPMSAVEAEFGGMNVSQMRPLGEVQKGYTPFLSDDVLFAKITPCMENGKVAVVPALSNHIAFGSTEFHVLRAQDGIRAAWLAHFLSQTGFRRFARQHMTGSAGQLRVSASWLSDTEIPVAPSEEQTRIVEKLEELLSDLDAGVAELKAAQKKLVQYRQTLLKAAVEGSLTADWRAKNPPTETGAQLLERILTERRTRWEAKQLAKFNEQGKTPPKDWQKKYPEPVQPDTTNLPKLPVGWVWASLGQLLDELTSGSRDWAPYYDRGSCIFVMAQNVRPWRPDFAFRQYVDPPVDHRDRARSEVRENDLLVTIVGAHTGQACRMHEPVTAHFVCQSVALLRLVQAGLSEYINAVLNSHGHGQRQFREMNYGAGRPHLSFDQIESVCIPLPSDDEQGEIIKRLERAWHAIQDVEIPCDLLLKQSSAQRKNILKAAFSGQLVQQDANDEPASVLLARIRAERAAVPKTSRARLHTRESA